MNTIVLFGPKNNLSGSPLFQVGFSFIGQYPISLAVALNRFSNAFSELTRPAIIFAEMAVAAEPTRISGIPLFIEH